MKIVTLGPGAALGVGPHIVLKVLSTRDGVVKLGVVAPPEQIIARVPRGAADAGGAARPGRRPRRLRRWPGPPSADRPPRSE